jgi:hypothetical protein
MTLNKFMKFPGRYAGIDSCDCLSSVRSRELYADSFGEMRATYHKTFHIFRERVIVECQECGATWISWEDPK